MMRGKYSLTKRIIAFALSLVLLLSVVPATGVLAAPTVSEGIVETEADPSTLDAWKTAFDPVNLTTEHAGGVWTDKSVLTQGDVADAFPNVSGLEVADNNFLVALSALAANSVVVGHGVTPTDTVFVLDISGSMGTTELNAMVAAANDAIHTLLTGNESNRIGVVLYSTRAYELLPLGRYTPVTDDQDTETTADDVIGYIELTNNSIRTARIRTWVENEDEDDNGRPGRPGGGNNGYWQTTDMLKIEGTDTQVDTSVNLRGGTYIQGGLWTALQQFNAATVTDTRNPVLVLMSDGAPTYLTNDYNNVPNNYESGDGNSSGDGDAFLTQLTAAYVKEKVEDKYGTAAYFYTLGLGVSSSDRGTTVAEAVLDTSKTRTDLEDYWDDFLALATAEDKTMSVELAGEGQGVTVTYDATVTSDSREFVDKYFPASDASQLSTAFQGIVNEISLKAGYTVTRLDGAGTNAGGYVTFVDEIGTGMQIKDIKGILIGDHLFTGVQLAKALIEGAFGTATEPTTLGDNMVWALKQRLGITETSVVHDLIQQAYDAGQIAYNTTTGEFSNYIGWYSDANGDYLGFWNYADPNDPIPQGAAYANMSYGMLGTTTDSQTAHASDMMYVAVMVSKKVTTVSGQPALEAKTPEMVTFRVPASLLPTVTYQITLNVESDEEITENTTGTITYNAADPIRLLYEVGVHSQLDPVTIQDFLRDEYEAIDEDGNYYLYTNAWYWEPSDGSAADFQNPPDKGNAVGKDVLYDTSRNHITYAHFEPSEENEHYYYTEDTVLYVKSGDTYTPATELVTDGSVEYYYLHRTYESKAAAAETGVAVEAKVSTHYGAIDPKVLTAKRDDGSDNYAQNDTTGVWYIKEGTMRYSVHSHDKLKGYPDSEIDPENPDKNNLTGSFSYRLHQLVDIGVEGDSSHHDEIMYLGNNGRVTYAPAQGFSLSKAMAEGAAADGSFTFTVTVSADSDGKYTETRSGVSQVKDITNNSFTVTLKAGELVYITGIDIGSTYTVKEEDQYGYKLGGIVSDSKSEDLAINLSNASVSDTVQTNKVHEITFTNDIQEYGNLLVSKDVTYNKGSEPENANSAQFTIKVTFTGLGGKTVWVNGDSKTLESDGSVTLTLKDGDQALITGIPEGTEYTVVEVLAEGTNDIPSGFTADDGYTVTEGTFTGTIVASQTQTAAVQNEYTPDDVEFQESTPPAVTITANKELVTDETGKSFNFTFKLQMYNGVDWEDVKAGEKILKDTLECTSDAKKNSLTFNLAGLKLSAVGTYYFRIVEDIPEVEEQTPGMAYDRTHHDFKVVVTDTDLDGKLEIASVEKVDETVSITPTDTDNDDTADKWAVSAGFTNTYIVNATKLTIEATKTLTNTITNENILKDGQFGFALYEVDDDTYDITGITDPKTAKNGAKGEIIFPTITYPYVEGEQYHYYVMKETSTDGKGVKVDTTVWEIRVKTNGNSSGEMAVQEIVWRKNGETNYSGSLTTIPENNVFNSIAFNNTYTPAPVEQAVIKATKTLTDLTPGAADTKLDVKENTFSFTLAAITDDAPMPVKTTVFASAGGSIDFGNITFTKADTYQYKLTENDHSAAGVTKDTAVYTITVVVEDNGAGALNVASVVYDRDGVHTDAIVFDNTYKAVPPEEPGKPDLSDNGFTEIVINGSKTLDVDAAFERTLKAGEFHFTLTKPDGTSETVSNAADGSFRFSTLKFDTLGTYTYTIEEYKPVAPNEDGEYVHNGITYDKSVYTVTVTVTDTVKDGVMEVAVDYKADGSAAQSIQFTNEYKASAVTVELEGYKDLVGRDLNEGEFSFTLSAVDNAPMPEGSENGKMTVENAQDGTIAFPAISYNAVGEYVYTVVENKPVEENEDGEYVHDGVTYSKLTYTVTVTVTDNELGALTASVSTVDNNGVNDPVEFANRYKAASVTVNLTGTDDEGNDTYGGKGLDDQSSATDKTVEDFEFQFVLTDAEGNEIETVVADSSGFDFANITYDTAGTYVYYIYELDDGQTGVTYDTAKYKVTVTVADKDLKGYLEADISYEKADTHDSETYESADAVTFENTYKAKKTSVSFAGKKTLEGGRKLKGDDFSFVLTAKNGAPMPEGNTTGTETVKNDAEGKFAFSAIEFTAEGEYVYTLVEQEGDNELIDYDGTEYTLTVTVKDENGELKATTKIEKGEDEVDSYGFTNIYTPADAETAITVQKVLDNKSDKTMGLDGYTFQLELDGEKTTLTTGTDGKVKFDLTFTAKDVDKTFTYKLTEVKGSVEGMTYDETVYEIKIAVTQNDDGELILTTTRKGTGDFTFTNTYAPEEPPKTPTENPKTGDEFSIHSWTLMMAVSAVCGLAVLVLGKKKLLAD